jgi:dihydroflavonol-4-reductase
MTTFITGATTSLGRVLVREFVRQGEAVRLLEQPDSNRSGLELPGVAFVRGDVTDSVAVRKAIAGCDRVCHIPTTFDGIGESQFWRIQREGTRNVFQAALDLHVASVVHVSSPTVLGSTNSGSRGPSRNGDGPSHDDFPADEQHRAGAPTSLWAKTQLAADEIAQEFLAKGAPAKIVYPGLGFGYVRPPGDSGLAEHTLLRLAGGKPTVLPAGDHHLAVTYFKDTAQGIALAHERGRTGERYLLVGASVTWSELWQAAAEIVGKPGPQRSTPLWWARLTNAFPPDLLELAGHDWNFHSTKAQIELGWEPLPLAEALAETWEEAQTQGIGARPPRPARVIRRA